LNYIYVDPLRQKHGLGTVLLNKAKTMSPTGLTLFTHQRNERARAFYERRGLRAVELGVSPPPESEPDVKYEWAPQAATGDVTIRDARENEAELLTGLAFRSKAYWGYSDEFMEACRQELTYTADDIRRLSFAVAECRSKVVGFYALAASSPDEVELEALFVEPSFIGKGCGRALIEHAKRRAAAGGAARLVLQGDPNAERFYRAAGGEPAGTEESASIPGRSLPLFHIPLSGLG
jgi:GNAT superfamily N-acetyltransferase